MNRLVLAAVTTFLFVLPAKAGTGGPAAPIRDGNHGCPHCTLAGADLSNQCLQGSDFEGADFDNAKLVLTCLSHANLKQASFRQADLSGANLFDTRLDGADFTGAVLSSTSLKGARMANAKGLTQTQLDQACGDGATKLPAGLRVRRCK